MMPIIQPLPTHYDPPTEYRKERETFAKMEVEFRLRYRITRRLIGLLHDIKDRARRRPERALQTRPLWSPRSQA